MAVEFKVQPDLPLKAAVSMLTNRFYFVKGSGSWGCTLITAATDRAIGVLQNKPDVGQAAEVQVNGVSKVISDGSGTAIAAWDLVGPNASGIAVKKATADFNCAGYAMDASAANGTVIGVLLIPGLVFRTLAG
jgi:hypothetical protein